MFSYQTINTSIKLLRIFDWTFILDNVPKCICWGSTLKLANKLWMFLEFGKLLIIHVYFQKTVTFVSKDLQTI